MFWWFQIEGARKTSHPRDKTQALVGNQTLRTHCIQLIRHNALMRGLDVNGKTGTRSLCVLSKKPFRTHSFMNAPAYLGMAFGKLDQILNCRIESLMRPQQANGAEKAEIGNRHQLDACHIKTSSDKTEAEA